MALTFGTILALAVAVVSLVLAVVGEISVILAGLLIALAIARLVP